MYRLPYCCCAFCRRCAGALVYLVGCAITPLTPRRMVLHVWFSWVQGSAAAAAMPFAICCHACCTAHRRLLPAQPSAACNMLYAAAIRAAMPFTAVLPATFFAGLDGVLRLLRLLYTA